MEAAKDANEPELGSGGKGKGKSKGKGQACQDNGTPGAPELKVDGHKGSPGDIGSCELDFPLVRTHGLGDKSVEEQRLNLIQDAKQGNKGAADVLRLLAAEDALVEFSDTQDLDSQAL